MTFSTLSQGSRLENSNAPQASHMYFAQGVDVLVASLFSTHPPLRERIQHIDPAWDGSFPALQEPSAEDAQTGPRPTAGLEKAVGLAMAAGVAVSRPENLTATIGQLDETHRR